MPMSPIPLTLDVENHVKSAFHAMRSDIAMYFKVSRRQVFDYIITEWNDKSAAKLEI
jgi:hypothetical protein